MTTPLPANNLQDSANRYARSLIVPSRLLALHPRKAGGVGNAAALAPAITLGVISAFEGFVEDFVATTLHLRGHSLAQIAKKVNLHNPDVSQFEKIVRREFPKTAAKIGEGFSVDVWYPPEGEKRLWNQVTLDWEQARLDAEAWMQVRHCLSHGLTSGWQSEVWPGPLKEGSAAASSVLNPKVAGKHSLVLHGAITCARIYRSAAQHIGSIVATELAGSISWRKLPEFPLYSTSYADYLAAKDN